MNKICGLVICKNEEKNIEACLKSILWCDEIVVADSFSSDNTLNIAKKYTDKIYQNEWKGFAAQRKFALSKAGSEWILSLDADERCSPELESEIRSVLSADNFSEEGFEIPRKSFFLGKWIKHCGWYPDHQLRLFRKDSGYVKERLVHEGYEVNGKIGKLRNDILHFTVNSISEFTNKINHYSDLSAIEKADNTRVILISLLFKPFFEFIKKFIFQLGFMDGIHGLMVSFFHMITKLLTYIKIWEIQNKEEK